MPRLRSAPGTQDEAATPRTTRQALKEKTNTARSKETVYVFEENIEDLVKVVRPKRGRARHAAQNEKELVMAGGLGQEESDQQSVESATAAPRTDDSTENGVKPTPGLKPNRRPARTTRKVVQNEAQTAVLQAMKERMQASKARGNAAATSSSDSQPVARPSSIARSQRQSPKLIQSNPAPHQRSEELVPPSLSSPPAAKSIVMKDKRSSLMQPASALKSHNTPANETSVLALKNFKRRPRQPSMLQMVQQRTASARPSAANVSIVGDASEYDVEDVSDDEGDFAPQASSTPLFVKKAGAPLLHSGELVLEAKDPRVAAMSWADGARKRKSDEIELSLPALNALKRRKSGAAPDEDGTDRLLEIPGRAPNSTPQRRETSQEAVLDVQVINSSPSFALTSDPLSPARRSFGDADAVIPSTEQEQANQDRDEDERDPLDDTMAEPLSSPSLPPDPLATQATDIMADPLTQLSPPKRSDKPKKAPKPKPMTTATLQSLLPKRRRPLQPRHRKSVYDLDSNSDPVDDESQLADSDGETGRRSKRHTKTPASSKAKKSSATKSKSRQSRLAPTAASSTRKSTATLAKKKTPAPGKTYGRTTTATATSDKENDYIDVLDDDDPSALPDNSISMIEAAQSKELEEARRKFAEVDEWDMEFENMSFEEGRSSSQNWR